MNTTTLLEKLVATERALQNSNYMAARALLMEAEDCVLQIEREMIHAQTEKVSVYSRAHAITLPSHARHSLMEGETRSDNRSWSKLPKMFSRMVVTAVRISLGWLPNPV